MTPDLILFFILGGIAFVTAVAMLTARNAVYSALLLVLNFITVAVLYLLLDAAFIAMVQVTVYAGAIMVLFLFVVMLLGAEQLSGKQTLKLQRPVAVLLGLGLLLQAGYALFAGKLVSSRTGGQVLQGFGSPAAVGLLLFRDYWLPIEIVSVLLLVAMVGAIVLSRGERKKAS